MLRKLALAGALALASMTSALSQTVPPFDPGSAPTKQTWNNYFAAKQDSSFNATGGTTAINLATRLGWQLTPQDFGAKCDAAVVTPVSVTSAASSPNVTFTGTSFSASDVGKNIVVPGLGTSGAPLATTISAVTSGTAITLGANAVTAQSALSTVIYYGHDDSAAFNALFAAIPGGSVVFVPKGNCLVASTITLPSFFTAASAENGAGIVITGAGQGASQIVAGGAGMSSIFVEPQTWHKAARFEHLTLDAAGVSTQAYWEASGYKGGAFDVAFNNGASQDLHVGDGSTNAQDSRYTDIALFNDTLIFTPAGGYPAYNLNAAGSDNQYTNVVAAYALTDNFYDHGAGDLYVQAHGWGGAQHAYSFQTLTSCSACEVDGATISGVLFNGWSNTWTGGFMHNISAGGYAFEFASGIQQNVVNNPVITGTTPNYFVLSDSSSRQYNNSINISGYVPGNNGSVPGTIYATTTSTSAVTMTLNNNGTPSASNLPYLQTFGVFTVNGTLMGRDSVSGAFGTWAVSLVIKTGGAAAAPTIISQSVVAGSGNTLSPSTAPVFVAPPAGTLSFYLNVSGASTDHTDWNFVPQYGGV